MENLVKGFSGKILIQKIGEEETTFQNKKDYSGLMTSYQISINNNILKSQGAFYLNNNSSSSLQMGQSRIAMQCLRDHPNYELSISLEINEKLFQFLIEELESYFSKPIYKVTFIDKYLDLMMIFNECFISNFVLSIQQQNIATVTLTFIYYKQTFNVEQIAKDSDDLLFHNYKKNKDKDIIKIKKYGVKKLMPYYSWGIKKETEKETEKLDSLINFTLTFARTITPKYGCVGQENKVHAIKPLAVVLSVPTITYDYTLLLTKNSKNSLITYTQGKKKGQDIIKTKKFDLSDYDEYDYKKSYKKILDKYNLQIYYKNNIVLKLQNCYDDTYTPNISSKNEKSISISGSMYGKIDSYEFVSDSDSESDSETE